MDIKSDIKFDKSVPIIFYKKTKSKVRYFNISTGKDSFVLEDIVDTSKDYCLAKEKSFGPTNIVDIQFDEKNELLVIIFLEIDTKKLKSRKKLNIKEIDRIYINKDKEFIYKKVEWGFDYQKGVYQAFVSPEYEKVPGHYVRSSTSYYIDKCEPFRTSIMEEVYKIFPRFVTLAGNNLVEIKDLSSLNKFLKYKDPTIINSDRQKEVDDITAIELPEIINIPNKEKFAIINKVNIDKKDMCVLRTFMKAQDGTIYEGGRIYIGKEKVIPCKMSNSGRYIKTTLLTSPENWTFYVDDFSSLDTKGTKLEYFGDIIDELDKDIQSMAIWAFIKWDLTEKLFKSEFKSFIKEILKRSTSLNPMNYLKNCVGSPANEKNIYKSLGLNKYQAKKMLNNWEENIVFSDFNFTPILITKILLCGIRFGYMYDFLHYENNEYFSISDFDNETFDKAYEIAKRISAMERQPGTYLKCLSTISRLYGTKQMLNSAESIFDIKDEGILNGYVGWYCRSLELYKDYLNMVEQMGDTVNFKYQFKDNDDIERMHNAAALVFSIKKDEYATNLFEKRYTKWKFWEYESDEFAIVAPQKPGELAYEGLALHHCVKSYIQRVADGETNVLFLRKKEDLTKPFFTIEIGNNGTIEQIHGFGNCNIDTNPEAIPFIEDWIKNKKLKKNSINKVR